jgi:hypothetical protein
MVRFLPLTSLKALLSVALSFPFLHEYTYDGGKEGTNAQSYYFNPHWDDRPWRRWQKQQKKPRRDNGQQHT